MDADVRTRLFVVVAELAVIALVPVALVLVHLFVPMDVQGGFVLRPDSLDQVTLFTSAFLHLDWSHLRGNLIGYVIAVGYIYLLCLHADERRWFWLTTVTLFLVLPVAINLSWVVIVHRVYPWLAAPTRGFSGVAAGFGGFLFVALLVALRSRRSCAIVRDVGFVVVLVLLGQLVLIYGGTSAALPISLVVLGLVLSLGELIWRGYRTGLPSTPAALQSVWLDGLITGWVFVALAVLLFGFFPRQLADGDGFTNVFAHGMGFVYGAVIARWGYRYWGMNTATN